MILKKRSICFESIAIIETDFQRFQITALLSKGLIKKEPFCLDLRSKVNSNGVRGFTIADSFFPFNLNNPSKYFYTIISIIRMYFSFELRCKTLYSTYYHGFSTRFLSRHINSGQKIMIDDGIGSMIFFTHKMYALENFNYRVKLAFVNLLNVVFGGKEILWNNINKYYTSYPIHFESGMIPEVLFYNLWENSYTTRDGVAFIGSPDVEFDRLAETHFVRILNSIFDEHDRIEYFVHPNERLEKFKRFYPKRLILRKGPVEEVFKDEGMPRLLYGFNSSVLLHLALTRNVEVQAFFGYSNTSYDEKIKDAFNSCGILTKDVSKI